MHKYWKQIAAGSLAVMLATPVPIQAAIKKSIYVGDVVSITAADLKVNKGYKSLSELNTIYSEAREKVGSAYSSIESGNNQNTNGNATGGGSGSNGSSGSLIDSIISNGDLSGLLPDKKKKTFTYEEFLELIKGQDSEIAQKYEEARKNMEDEQKKGDKESAKYIEDAIKKAMNGINPVTGEAYESTDHPLDINDSLADETQRFMDWVDGNLENENSAAEMEKENLDKMLEYIRDDVENNVLAGNHSLVNFTRLSEDDYIDDELILERGDFEDQYTGHIPGMDGYKTIKYRCSKCGKIYSFSNVCDCGKFLLNYLYESDKYSNRLPFTDWWVSGFYEFDKDGEASNSSLTHATIKCGFCGKKLTAKAFDFKADKEDRFYYTSSLPDYMEHKKRPVNFNDLSFIGLTGAQGRYIWMYINRTDDVNVPPGYYIDYKSKEDGEYNVYQKERADSFFELMDTDLPTAKTLAINKCIETRSYYYGMLKMLDDPKTDLGESAKNPEFKHEATVFLNSQIQKVNRISKKIKSL